MKTEIIIGVSGGVLCTIFNATVFHLDFLSPEWWAMSVAFNVAWAFLCLPVIHWILPQEDGRP